MHRRIWVPLLILGAALAHGAVLSWTTAGPETGAVTVVRFDPTHPQIVWAGTRGLGVFRSNDAGLTWAQAGSGIIGRSATAIVVDPSNSSTVYAGTPLGTIFKTTDGGAAWVSSGSGLFPGGAPIRAMAMDPATPSTIYVATESQAVFPSLGVQKSTNGGQTWPMPAQTVWERRMSTHSASIVRIRRRSTRADCGTTPIAPCSRPRMAVRAGFRSRRASPY